jgi:oligopeptide/dipeptide ABC transporter ATP-binding protein
MTATAAASRPSESDDADSPLLEVRNLSKVFPIRRGLFAGGGTVKAVQDVSFSIRRGEVLGLVGESGSGKTTLGRIVLRLEAATSGEVKFNGRNIYAFDADTMRATRKSMQIIFQDPYASLNPRLTIREILSQPLRIHRLALGPARESRLSELLERVGLPTAYLDRYPHEFSGGQRQRIGIARALACEPQFIVADEAVSALDVSIRAQVVNLLQDLRKELGLTMLFIAHDLGIVEYISDRVAVMYLGRIMEIARAQDLYRNPRHPYTQALLSAIPIPDPTVKRKRTILKGDIPSPINPPSGCVFRTRCPIATSECSQVTPAPQQMGDEHFAACIKL